MTAISQTIFSDAFLTVNHHWFRQLPGHGQQSQNHDNFKPYSHYHGDVIKWKHFTRYWPFIYRSPVDSRHKGQWRGALMFLWSAPEKKNGWANNRDAHDLRRHRVQQFLQFHVQTNANYVFDLHFPMTVPQIDGLVQERRNSIANALELSLSCTNPSRWKINYFAWCGCYIFQ